MSPRSTNPRSRRKNADIRSTCPCGALSPYAQCCGPLLDGQQPADTAEALMRARYTAFTLAHAPYLLTSWHPDTQPTEITVDTNQRWQGLNILGCTLGTQQDATGTVEFIARYKVNGRAHRLHEVSRFGRVDGRWVYINGDLAGDDPQYSMT